MTKLDNNRAVAKILKKLGVDNKNLRILLFREITVPLNTPRWITLTFKATKWIQGEFIVQQRGAAIIQAIKLSSTACIKRLGQKS